MQLSYHTKAQLSPGNSTYLLPLFKNPNHSLNRRELGTRLPVLLDFLAWYQTEIEAGFCLVVSCLCPTTYYQFSRYRPMEAVGSTSEQQQHQAHLRHLKDTAMFWVPQGATIQVFPPLVSQESS